MRVPIRLSLAHENGEDDQFAFVGQIVGFTYDNRADARKLVRVVVLVRGAIAGALTRVRRRRAFTVTTGAGTMTTLDNAITNGWAEAQRHDPEPTVVYFRDLLARYPHDREVVFAYLVRSTTPDMRPRPPKPTNRPLRPGLMETTSAVGCSNTAAPYVIWSASTKPSLSWRKPTNCSPDTTP